MTTATFPDPLLPTALTAQCLCHLESEEAGSFAALFGVLFLGSLTDRLVISYITDVCIFEISSSHGGEYEVQNCLLGCTAV
jgi:hypothetical protein